MYNVIYKYPSIYHS